MSPQTFIILALVVLAASAATADDACPGAHDPAHSAQSGAPDAACPAESVDPDRSAYAGEEARAIKALSEDEIAAYLRGDGMGYAKAAELNSYPGPKHVLALADRLTLSKQQLQETEAIYERMRSDAARIGKRLVDAEAGLDAAFASASIDAERLKVALQQIAELQGELRNVHLQAHLEQTDLLSAEQIRHYDAIRGYGDGGHHH